MTARRAARALLAAVGVLALAGCPDPTPSPEDPCSTPGAVLEVDGAAYVCRGRPPGRWEPA